MLITLLVKIEQLDVSLFFIFEMSTPLNGLNYSFIQLYITHRLYNNCTLMSGLFGVITEKPCATDLFYGTDYHSHLGTRRAGLSTIDNDVMHLNIHNIENTQFKTKFSSDIHEMLGNKGIGVISDTDAQPIVCNSHLGRFAVCTVSRINNISELEGLCLSKNQQFTELSMGRTNPSELIALLITQGKDFADGITNVYNLVRGSVSFLILTNNGIIAARDRYGRTPLTIGRRDNDYAVASESHSYVNLGFTTIYHVQPGEAVLINHNGLTQLTKPSDKMQICSFLWIYYGFPCVEYEDINAEEVRYRLGEEGPHRRRVCRLCLGHPRLGRGHGTRLCYGQTHPLQTRYSKIHPHVGSQFHACQPRGPQPCRQDETHPFAKNA